MSIEFSTTEVTEALRTFRIRRDDLLHEDIKTIDDHMLRFVKFCRENPLAQQVLNPLLADYVFDVKDWLQKAGRVDGPLIFPDSSDEEFALRYKLIEFVCDSDEGGQLIRMIGRNRNVYKHDESIELFRTLIIRPFMEEIGNRLGKIANLASPDDRAIQAVPLSRIPSLNEAKIFLSHKSVDKPLVRRYYNTLQLLGFSPWLDESNMTAGSSLERSLLQGFEESCAAVFFITENFKDENYLGAEVEYAIMQKRKKNKKFAIITLRYSDAAPVPGLLTPYTYANVSNDLDGFHELTRALPVELGPMRWKADIVK